MTNEEIEKAGIAHAHGDKGDRAHLSFVSGAQWYRDNHAPKWISVKERLPEDHKPKWCIENGKHQFNGFYTKGDEIVCDDDEYDGELSEKEEDSGELYLKTGWYEEIDTSQIQTEYDYYYVKRNVTHWQELPKPPEQ